MRRLSFIPNAFTMGNLLCGIFCLFTYPASKLVLVLFLIACLLDFLDGFVARLLGVQSEIGKQLDSLADMVTFGVVPGFIWVFYITNFPGSIPKSFENFGFLFLLIPVASAYRLAKFNIATDQSTDFKGLPTPANALFWVSLLYCLKAELLAGFLSGVREQKVVVFLCALAMIFSYLMISNIPMFGLKFKNPSFKGNFWKYLLLTSSLILLVFFKWLALPLIVVLYIILSIIKNLVK